MKKNRCVKCGRILTDPMSLAVGMGPECRGALSHKGWRFPKPRWVVQHGRTVLVDVKGKIEPPIGDVSESTKKIMKQLQERKASDEVENSSD